MASRLGLADPGRQKKALYGFGRESRWRRRRHGQDRHGCAPSAWREVFTQPIPGGPTTRGFDEYFGTDIPNWPPYCFIENDRTLGIPSEVLAVEKLAKNQASLQGPALPGWTFEPVLPTLTDRACDFITRQAKARTPFLLYLPLTTPHTPLAVNEAWRGKSGLDSAAADLIMETDDMVGRVLNALEASGIAGETLVLFTSDNGFAPYVGAADLEKRGHYPSGPLRGYKFDVWEGGHREPFIVRWPGVVKPGGVCGQLVHQADILRTLADILGTKLPDNAGEDSFSLLPLLKGEDKPIRPHAVSCAGSGTPGLRKGDWKFIPGKNPELYNLAQDIGETKNLAGDKPELVDEMKVLLEQLITDGRSTPGAKQKNDIKVRRFPDNESSPEAKVKKTNPPSSMDFTQRIPQVLPKSAIFRQPGWCLWDPCIVKGKDGLYHLLYSRWKTSLGFDAWCTHAEIAWAVSSKAEGPYEFRGTVLPQRGAEFWDGHSVYNTCVIRIGETFYLYYTGNRGTADWKPDRVIQSNDKEWWVHRNHQRIGVATADSPGGPWKRLDQPILDVGQGFGQTIINVPVMIQKPDGGLRLYYKTLGEGPGKFGSGVFHFAADAETPTGPFHRHPEPMVNKNKLMPEVKKPFDFHIDDHFEWWQDDRYYAIVKDHDAPYLTPHGRSLLLFDSPDGITWRPSKHSLVQDFSISWEDGKDQTFERLEMPKLLMENGQPRILSLAALEQGAKESFLVIVPLSVPE